ncbi:MAG: ABC transporter ATP-binding protein/permease [Bacilli bacterium]|nr:ABC transporter ATP-binding protein/permease [Bacilli bacterium]
MLELKKITKEYKTEGFTQKALDKVSINFRKNEFASILGPSGSGKTTLLNIIGGLDHYDSGDLIINETSTKKYKDRDWDTYRNHRVGFVFQSYNLITHQTVLANVELALTLSGVSKSVRKKKAREALKAVGLEKHIHKKPSQLSGGQMQRVAIARALVNDPEILLADEPTGALDSNTSKQIMEILADVAKDRLVIMVTHNPELANDYSTRIIKVKDGKVLDDTNPYDGSTDTKLDAYETKNKTKKTSMNFLTALSLSLNNLMTKKGRTILTAFAGSIGIIGIALILSLSNGVNEYITNLQKETMLSYPLVIEEESIDYSSLMNAGNNINEDKEIKHKKDAIYTDNSSIEVFNTFSNNVTKNNLTEFKKYLDDKNSEINKYIGENGIVYSYNTKFDVYNFDSDGKLINSDGSNFKRSETREYNFNMYNNSIFTELMSKSNSSESVSDAVLNEYDVVYGDWPTKYDEVVLVLDKNNELPLATIYNLGLLPSKEYKEIVNKMDNRENIEVEEKKISYEDIVNTKFKLLTATDYYIKNKKGLFDYIGGNEGKVEELVKNNSLELKVVGVVRQKTTSKTATINGNVGYTKALTDWIIKHTDESDVVVAQEKNKDKNVINGINFAISTDKDKLEAAKIYISNLSTSEKANLSNLIMESMANSAMSSNIMSMSEEQIAAMFDQYFKNPDEDFLMNIYDNYINSGSYENNMTEFGKVNIDSPSSIQIYTDSFENKDKVTNAIDNYNSKADESDKISYTDLVGLLMSSVTKIINTISYVLIAFVSISLVVSSIMIAIITYISVLERTKEIGILRAVGASKKDVTHVFNAETFIEGLVAGVMGILITILLNIPINILIKKLVDIDKVASLPFMGGLILVIISVILTVIAGLIPSKMAAKKDPVESLRSE